MCKGKERNSIDHPSRGTEIYVPHLKKKVRVDKCMANLIVMLNTAGIKTLACCCGHGKFNQSIVIMQGDGSRLELISNKRVPRSRRFYFRQGRSFYIPEALDDSTRERIHKRK